MEEMTREEMQRFLNMEHRDGHSELKAYRDLMEILGLAFPGSPKNCEGGEGNVIENAK